MLSNDDYKECLIEDYFNRTTPKLSEHNKSDFILKLIAMIEMKIQIESIPKTTCDVKCKFYIFTLFLPELSVLLN